MVNQHHKKLCVSGGVWLHLFRAGVVLTGTSPLLSNPPLCGM